MHLLLGGGVPSYAATVNPIPLIEPPPSVFRGATGSALALLDAEESTNGT